MKTKATELLGIEVPIFAFSHCRDVVIEVSRAGGCGVLGVAYHNATQLREELNWIESHIEGKPYGIDILLPGKYENWKAHDHPCGSSCAAARLSARLSRPGRHSFPEDQGMILDRALATIQMTPEQSRELVEVALEYNIKMVVNALGVPDREMVDRLHARGIVVGAMVGKPEHAIRQRDAGVDIIIAQGAEAGGHTGTLTSMILWPKWSMRSPLPVLRGRHRNRSPGSCRWRSVPRASGAVRPG